MRGEWRNQARCLGMVTAEFDPWCEPLQVVHRHTAIETCSICPVRFDCLKEALAERDDFGIRGGLLGRQRRALRKAKYRKQCPACRGGNIVNGDRAQTCKHCGISWPLPNEQE